MHIVHRSKNCKEVKKERHSIWKCSMGVPLVRTISNRRCCRVLPVGQLGEGMQDPPDRPLAFHLLYSLQWFLWSFKLEELIYFPRIGKCHPLPQNFFPEKWRYNFIHCNDVRRSVFILTAKRAHFFPLFHLLSPPPLPTSIHLRKLNFTCGSQGNSATTLHLLILRWAKCWKV